MPVSIPGLGLSFGNKGPSQRTQTFTNTINAPNFGQQSQSPTTIPSGGNLGTGGSTSQLAIVGGVLILGIIVLALVTRKKGRKNA